MKNMPSMTTTVPPIAERETAWLARVRLRAQRRATWLKTLWAGEGFGDDMFMAASSAEVERILADPVVLAAAERAFYASNPDTVELSDFIEEADARAAQDQRWSMLCDALSLGERERDLLALTVAVEVDPSFRRVCAFLQDDASAELPTPLLAKQLFDWETTGETQSSLDSRAALVGWRLAYPAESPWRAWADTAPWRADGAVVAWLAQGRPLHTAFGEAVTVVTREEVEELPVLYAEVRDEIEAFLTALGATEGKSPPLVVELVGPRGAGKRTLAAQIARRMHRNLLAVDVGRLTADLPSANAEDELRRAVRAARLHGLLIYWHGIGELDAQLWNELAGENVCFAGASSPTAASPEGAVRRSFTLPPLTRAQRIRLWQEVTEVEAPEAIATWRLTPGEIAQAARVSAAGQDAVVAVARQLLYQGQSELFVPLPLPYTWDDIVLTAAAKEHLTDLEDQARLRWQVYEEWGFGRLVPLGKGISALFAGPSGTGKTMAAQVLARSLGMELYRVDLAGVMNKYIGETEKRLKQVFDACERANVLLFFDEADALFGQRTQVKDAHDRFANIEIDYLLQRMEQFDGIAILATNRKGDLDKAFLRRLRFIVDFLPPSPAERLSLWRKALPATAPDGTPLLQEIDWEWLAAKLTMTGADIKSAALGAAFLARASGTRITMAHVLKAARREVGKHGVVVRPGEWDA